MSTDQQTIDWYDENAEAYAASVKGSDASPYHIYYEKPAIYGLLPELKNKAVLSLGCGSGQDSSYLKAHGAARSVGIDISKGLIEIAKREHPECDFMVGDMEKLPFKEGEFDLIYSSFALHYLPTYQKAFNESYRVLKSGGTLLFSVGHPIGSALEVITINEDLQEKLLGVVKDRKTRTKKVYGNYLSHESFRTHIAKFDVTYWKQPISDTINQLVGSGFIIEMCVEPKPTDDFNKVDPEDYKMLLRIPDIIIFKARKS